MEGNVLYVKGLDAINGTPILDIKPYIEKIEHYQEEDRPSRGAKSREN